MSVVNVMDYGATGNGSTDDTAAIQNAIDALPITGGVVFFPIPASCYKITATLTIGTGTSSVVSTRQGVVLFGAGMPPAPVNFTGYPASSGVRIKWVNASGDSMIAIKGPLQGWGLKNLSLDGNSQATVGVKVTSAQFGDCRNLSIQNCTTHAIFSTTFNRSGFSGVSNVDSLHNSWRNITILIPNVLNAFGVLLQNDGGSFTSDTDYNQFENLFIQGPGTATNVFFIYIQVADGNTFRGVHLSGTNANNYALAFDYNVTSAMPSDNTLEDIDFGSSAARIVNAGTPSGSGLAPNRVVNIHGTNGAPGNPGLSNLAWGAW